MSVEKLERASGVVWRVRWRDEQGQPRSRVVGKKCDALTFDQELKRAKRLGAGTPTFNNRETLAEFSQLWWARHAKPNLARHTQESYASALDVHIIPRLGDTRLTSLTTELLSDMRADMAASGVGEQAIRKVLAVHSRFSSARSSGATSKRTRSAPFASRASTGRVWCDRSRPRPSS